MLFCGHYCCLQRDKVFSGKSKSNNKLGIYFRIYAQSPIIKWYFSVVALSRLLLMARIGPLSKSFSRHFKVCVYLCTNYLISTL